MAGIVQDDLTQLADRIVDAEREHTAGVLALPEGDDRGEGKNRPQRWDCKPKINPEADKAFLYSFRVLPMFMRT